MDLFLCRMFSVMVLGVQGWLVGIDCGVIFISLLFSMVILFLVGVLLMVMWLFLIYCWMWLCENLGMRLDKILFSCWLMILLFRWKFRGFSLEMFLLLVCLLLLKLFFSGRLVFIGVLLFVIGRGFLCDISYNCWIGLIVFWVLMQLVWVGVWCYV